MQGVRDYLKFLKRGYGRTAHLTSIDVRNKRMPRSEALRLTEAADGRRPASLDVFLEYVGLNEKEFLEIALGHTVSPHEPKPESMPRGEELWDQKLWDRG
jgi:hypothetical protein